MELQVERTKKTLFGQLALRNFRKGRRTLGHLIWLLFPEAPLGSWLMNVCLSFAVLNSLAANHWDREMVSSRGRALLWCWFSDYANCLTSELNMIKLISLVDNFSKQRIGVGGCLFSINSDLQQLFAVALEETRRWGYDQERVLWLTQGDMECHVLWVSVCISQSKTIRCVETESSEVN